MSQETKNEAFHRLAQARKEALLEKIRLFGQLSGPSYDWTPDEVWAYFGEITQALEAALARFQEQKRWGASAEPVDAAPEPPEGGESPSPIPAESNEPVDQGAARERRRRRSIGELIEAARNDTEMLPEMLVLQKEVIADLQRQLNQYKINSREVQS